MDVGSGHVATAAAVLVPKPWGYERGARNRVGTVGTALETVVETVVKHIETVTSLFQGLNLNT